MRVLNYRRAVFVIVAILLLGILGFLAWRSSPGPDPQQDQKPTPEHGSSNIRESRHQANHQVLETSADRLAADSDQAQNPPVSAPNELGDQEKWLEGQVIDPSFAGISKARIYPYTMGNQAGQKYFYTDEHGYFKLPDIGYTGILIHVSAAGYTSRNLTFPIPNVPQANKIQLTPGGELELFVKDEFDRPISGANVFQFAIDDGLSQTDGAGMVQLHRLMNPTNLLVQAEGFNDLRTTIPLDSENPNVTLLKNGTIFGIVVDQEEGKPISEFSIEMRSFEENPQTLSFDSPDGRFEVNDLSRTQVNYIFSAPGYLTRAVHLEACLPKDRSEPLEVRMSSQGVTYAGRVFDPQGTPLANATVTAFTGETIAAGRNPGRFPPKKMDGDWWLAFKGWLDAITTTTDSQGRFEIGPLPSASYLSFLTEAEGFAPKFDPQMETLVAKERRGLEIVLQPCAKIRIRIGQEDYPGIRILRIRDSTQQYKEYEIQQGERELFLEDVAPGEIVLDLYPGQSDYLATENPQALIDDRKELTIAPAELQEVQIGISEALSLSGRVLLDGIPMANRLVILDQQVEPSQFHRTQTDGQGYFTFSPLKPGHYEMMANGSNDDMTFAAANRNLFELTADRTDFLLDIPSMGSVFGRLKNKPADTHLSLHMRYKVGENGSQSTQKHTYLKPDGSFEFPHVPPGTFSLVMRPTHEAVEQTMVTDRTMPGGGVDVDLGILDQEKGSLRLELRGYQAYKDIHVTVEQVFTQGERETSQYFTDLTHWQPTNLVQGLELGPIWLKASVGNGFRLEPAEGIFHLIEDQQVLASFDVIGETYLEVRNRDPERESPFFWARLIRESDGKIWEMPQRNYRTTASQDISTPELYVSPRFALATRLPEGWWRIELTNINGMAARRIQLIKGTPMSITLEPGDFTQREKKAPSRD